MHQTKLQNIASFTLGFVDERILAENNSIDLEKIKNSINIQ